MAGLGEAGVSPRLLNLRMDRDRTRPSRFGPRWGLTALVRCPVLIVFGARDRITPPHQARYFLNASPTPSDRAAWRRPCSDERRPRLVARTILDFSDQGRGDRW
jgi:pimeloyl-ACP methyl ester carboxylesterase